MTSPTHYPLSINYSKSNIFYVSIQNIIFDKGMIETSKEKGVKLSGIKIFPTNNPKSQGFKLNKWDNVYNDIENKIDLDPIKLKKYNKDYYEVIDGRHRVVTSLKYGYIFIPAVILAN
uniref:ParB/Sulfiredoxin domain-containing protein n=1 Tax=viral metagenome TaxID=1070528 RepID=A0A6C0IWC6_9ZZZZ